MTPKRSVGAAVGIVTRLDDPAQQGRILVEFPWIGDGIQSNWCRIRQMQGGPGRGSFIRPELGDEVLVLFEQGDINQPWIVGCLWNGKDAPPGPGNADGKNDSKFFQTRAGHQLIFGDGTDGGHIAIHDGKGRLHTTFDVPGQHIHTLADTGEISISAPAGTVRIECHDLNVKSTETTTVAVQNRHALTVTGTRKLTVEDHDLNQPATARLAVTTPSLDLTVRDAADVTTGATTLTVGSTRADIKPLLLIDQQGPVTRNHTQAIWNFDDYCTELDLGRSGPLTLHATSLGITADETFIARIGGAIDLQGGQTKLSGVTVALGKDGGDGASMGKASLISISGGLVNLNPQQFTGPATKMGDLMIGIDVHKVAPGIPPVAVSPMLLPHGFALPVNLDCKATVLINGVAMAGSGSTACGLHTPPFLPLPWTPIFNTPRQMLAGATLALFMPALMAAGSMITGAAQAAAALSNPGGALTGLDAQQWRVRLLPYTASPGAFLAFLAGLAPYPIASGSITIGSPNVLGEDMPMSMLVPMPFSNSCSDIPVVPNATVLASSTVMIGVSLEQILAQLAMSLVAYGVARGIQSTRFYQNLAGPSHPRSQYRCGDPVDIVSGARVDEDIDLTMPGPLPLTLTRQHVSTAVGRGEGGVLGLGNRLCFEQRLESPALAARPDRVWIWHTPELRQVELPWLEDLGQWHFDRPEKIEICRAGPDTWDLTDLEGITHRFERWSSRSARLVARFDRDGNTITFHYHPHHPQHLVALTDSAGRRYRLDHNETPHGDRLRAIWCVHPEHRRLRTYDYDDRGRLIATAGPDGVPTHYTHDDQGRITTRLEPSGYTWHWHYDTEDRVTCTYGDDLRYYYTFDYQPAVDMTITRDHAGNRTLWHYDGQRTVDRIIDPEGGIREEAWTDNDLTATSTGRGLAVERQYDPHGRLLEETLIGGGKRRFEYDPRGHLIAATGPTGETTLYTRDDRGHATTIRHPDGARTLRRYDPRGHLIAEVTPDGIEHAFTYDERGDLIEETHDGATTTHRYDAFGHRTETTDPAGRTTRYHNDPAGRPLRTVWPDGREERRAYDAAGNCIEHTTRNGGTWRYVYDGAGRKVRTHTPEGRVLISDYGLNDRHAGHRTPTGRGFAYAYDRCDRLARHTTDDGVTDRYTYDPAGRLTRSDHDDGAFIEWTPAPHGEPLVTTTRDGTRQSWTYDPAARVVEAIEHPPGARRRLEADRPSPDEIRVAFTRRADGVVLAEHGPHGDIKYGYAPGSHLVRYRVDDTDTTITRDARGRPVAINAPDGRWRIEHDPFGERWTAPDGTTHRVAADGWSIRDPDGRPIAAYAADFDDLGDCTGETLRRLADGAAKGYHHTHHYDLDRRLDGAVDPDGNRRLEGATYGPGNRLLRDVNGEVTHDPRGRITRRHDADGEHRYRWDDLGRLTEIETPDGTIYAYRYDAFHRLIERTADPIAGPTTRSTFLWAGDVLAGEDRPDGTRIRYLRLAARDWTPWAAWVAPPDGKGALHRLHTDTRGAVVAATSAGRLSWWGEYEPYGDLTATGGPFDQRLRLPGMWADPDTGLCYNRFRWYVPTWGRYLSPDPLGVEGNRNVYAYTDGDPIHFVDPLGLNGKCPLEAPATSAKGKPKALGDPESGTQNQGTRANEPSDASEGGPYSHLRDHPSVGPGKDFTQTQKNKILEANRKANGGQLVDDESGEALVPPTKSQKGVVPDPMEAQVDHRHPKSKGGTNSYTNAQVLARKNNIKKSNRTPDDP